MNLYISIRTWVYIKNVDIYIKPAGIPKTWICIQDLDLYLRLKCIFKIKTYIKLKLIYLKYYLQFIAKT